MLIPLQSITPWMVLGTIRLSGSVPDSKRLYILEWCLGTPVLNQNPIGPGAGLACSREMVSAPENLQVKHQTGNGYGTQVHRKVQGSNETIVASMVGCDFRTQAAQLLSRSWQKWEGLLIFLVRWLRGGGRLQAPFRIYMPARHIWQVSSDGLITEIIMAARSQYKSFHH